MPTFHKVQQRSEEWFALRLGKVTASRIADLTAKTKSGWGASRKNYMTELVAERLTGSKADSYSNAAMQWGIDMEPEARALYIFEQGVEVEEVGFVSSDIEGLGCSPDGLVGEDGLLEIKCPNQSTHVDYLLTRKIPERYMKQMQLQMAICERQWCDFVSYDPRFIPKPRPDGTVPRDKWSYRCERVQRTDDAEDLVEQAVVFLAELDALEETLRELEN